MIIEKLCVCLRCTEAVDVQWVDIQTQVKGAARLCIPKVCTEMPEKVEQTFIFLHILANRAARNSRTQVQGIATHTKSVVVVKTRLDNIDTVT